MDVLIIYERKLRELENALLLKLELEKRGLTCEIRQFYEISLSNLLGLKKYKIILAPHLYSTKSIPRIYSRFGKADNIINLQYEQVLSKKWEKLGVHNPQGEAKKAYHICWGESTQQRLVDTGVDVSRIRTLGAVQLDMLRKEYREQYFDAREVLGRKYNLPTNKKWSVFISSLSYANITEERLKNNEALTNTSMKYYADNHTENRHLFLEWFEKILEKNKENIFIYRPHPEELSLEPVEKLALKFENFVIIPDESVKTWIANCDKVYSWFSTSVIEAHFLNKKYSILRPIKLLDEADSVLLKKARFIESYSEFEEDYFSDIAIEELPLDDDDVNDYYLIDSKKPAFVKYVDFIIDLIDSGDKTDFNISFMTTCTAKIKSALALIVYKVYLLNKRNVNRIKDKNNYNYLERWFIEMSNQISSKSEIKEKYTKLKEVYSYKY